MWSKPNRNGLLNKVLFISKAPPFSGFAGPLSELPVVRKRPPWGARFRKECGYFLERFKILLLRALTAFSRLGPIPNAPAYRLRQRTRPLQRDSSAPSSLAPAAGPNACRRIRLQRRRR